MVQRGEIWQRTLDLSHPIQPMDSTAATFSRALTGLQVTNREPILMGYTQFTLEVLSGANVHALWPS